MHQSVEDVQDLSHELAAIDVNEVSMLFACRSRSEQRRISHNGKLQLNRCQHRSGKWWTLMSMFVPSRIEQGHIAPKVQMILERIGTWSEEVITMARSWLETSSISRSK